MKISLMLIIAILGGVFGYFAYNAHDTAQQNTTTIIGTTTTTTTTLNQCPKVEMPICPVCNNTPYLLRQQIDSLEKNNTFLKNKITYIKNETNNLLFLVNVTIENTHNLTANSSSKNKITNINSTARELSRRIEYILRR